MFSSDMLAVGISEGQSRVAAGYVVRCWAWMSPQFWVGEVAAAMEILQHVKIRGNDGDD